MKDIQARDDIELLVKAFYSDAMTDEVIQHFFIDVVKLNLNTHLETICDFWEGILLDKITYRGNTMLKHIDLHRKSPLKAAHFERWLQLWFENIDQHFVGKKAQMAKSRANQIAQLMQHKTGNLG